ncbi:MAG: DUF3568 family protein [Candidatus Omnitrophota bacterium]
MRKFWAVQKMLWTAILSLFMCSLNGCVYLVVGGVGALGGYVVSPDTVEGTIVEKDYEDVWSAASEVLSNSGMVEEENELNGTIIARVQGARVHVSVFRVGTNTAKLSVKARKSILPKIMIAQDVYVKIVEAIDGN